MPLSKRSAAIALALVVPAPSIGALVSFWLAPGPIGLVVYGLCKGLLYLTPALWSRFVDREPWSLSPARRGGFAIGAALGIAIGIAIFITWWLLGDAAIDVASLRAVLEQNGINTKSKYFATVAWLVIVNGSLEEYAFRWFITTRWMTITPRHAIWLSALSFAAHHAIIMAKYLPWPTAILATSGVFTGGLVWSWLYRRCGSIWPGYLSHALVDLAIVAIGYIALF